MDLSHDDCLALINNPSARIVLETLGYDYSPSGHSSFRKDRPNIMPALVQAIVTELERHPCFHRSLANRSPQSA
jgi:hypothetical protein